MQDSNTAMDVIKSESLLYQKEQPVQKIWAFTPWPHPSTEKYIPWPFRDRPLPFLEYISATIIHVISLLSIIYQIEGPAPGPQDPKKRFVENIVFFRI